MVATTSERIVVFVFMRDLPSEVKTDCFCQIQDSAHGSTISYKNYRIIWGKVIYPTAAKMRGGKMPKIAKGKTSMRWPKQQGAVQIRGAKILRSVVKRLKIKRGATRLIYRRCFVFQDLDERLVETRAVCSLRWVDMLADASLS